jgi:hypothetical protein
VDSLAVIAKITGVVLLLGTFRSMYMHFFMQRVPNAENPETNHKGLVSRNDAFVKNAPSATVSISEKLLNNLLLYLWFAFLLSFSIGLLLNN